MHNTVSSMADNSWYNTVYEINFTPFTESGNHFVCVCVCVFTLTYMHKQTRVYEACDWV
jgi:hypothetical protein